MVVIDRWSLCRSTVSNDLLIKQYFLKMSACQIWRENYFGQNQPFTKFVEAAKQLNEVTRSGKALHEVSKICEQLYEVRRICQ